MFWWCKHIAIHRSNNSIRNFEFGGRRDVFNTYLTFYPSLDAILPFFKSCLSPYCWSSGLHPIILLFKCICFLVITTILNKVLHFRLYLFNFFFLICISFFSWCVSSCWFLFCFLKKFIIFPVASRRYWTTWNKAHEISMKF